MKITASVGLQDNTGTVYGHERVKGLIASRFQGASVVWADGLWEGKWEPCAIVTVICDNGEQASIIGKLREIGFMLHQDCILIDISRSCPSFSTRKEQTMDNVKEKNDDATLQEYGEALRSGNIVLAEKIRVANPDLFPPLAQLPGRCC